MEQLLGAFVGMAVTLCIIGIIIGAIGSIVKEFEGKGKK